MVFHVRTEAETMALAGRLGRLLWQGDVVFLSGGLGMGKSVFARALIRTLCGQPQMDVPSPTFTLMQGYDTPAGPVAHFDLYRIKNPEEIYELGWEETLGSAITLVEWPERLAPGQAPPDRLALAFAAPSTPEPQARMITITPFGQWTTRWKDMPQ